jgi:8-oxo-dGTP pyrophosphatase MutT (NUDIX family)
MPFVEDNDGQKIRHAARAVIVDDDRRIAILEVNNGEYFKIPGGGVEFGESIEEALRREAREEAGCDIEILEEIGRWDFPMSQGINRSVCFLAKKTGLGGDTAFTDKESAEGFRLLWIYPNEAMSLFDGAKPQNERNRHMNERDKNFVALARERF